MRYEFATASREYLKSELRVKEATEEDPKGLAFNSYSGVAHSTSDKELDDLLAWLKKMLPA